MLWLHVSKQCKEKRRHHISLNAFDNHEHVKMIEDLVFLFTYFISVKEIQFLARISANYTSRCSHSAKKAYQLIILSQTMITKLRFISNPRR